MKKQWICGMMVFLLFTACRRSPQIEKTLLSSSPLEDVISTAFCQVNVRGEKQIVSSGQDNIRFVIPSFQDCTAVVTFEEEVEPIQVTIQEKSGATFSITAEKEDAFAHVFSLPRLEGTYEVRFATPWKEPISKFEGQFSLIVGNGVYTGENTVLPLYALDDPSLSLTLTVESSPYQFALTNMWLEDLYAMQLVPKASLSEAKGLPLATSFTIEIACQGKTDQLYLSKEGIRYQGILYYPRNMLAFQSLLEKDSDQLLSRTFLDMGELLAVSYDQIVRIEMGVTPMMAPTQTTILDTPEEVQAYLQQFGALPVHIWQPQEDRPGAGGGYTYTWSFLLQDGGEILLCDSNGEAEITAPDGETTAFCFGPAVNREKIFLQYFEEEKKR